MAIKIVPIIFFLLVVSASADTVKAVFCPSTITISKLPAYLDQPSFIWVGYNDQGKFFSSYPFTRIADAPYPATLNVSLTAYNDAAKTLLCTYNVQSGGQPVTMQNRGDY